MRLKETSKVSCAEPALLSFLAVSPLRMRFRPVLAKREQMRRVAAHG